MRGIRLATLCVVILRHLATANGFVIEQGLVPWPRTYSAIPSSQVRPFPAVKSSQLSMSIPAAQSARKKRLASGMAFLTGFADVALFLKYQTFSTMMTGNTLWLARAAVEQQYSLVAYYASVIIAYACGLAVFRRLDMSLRKEAMRVCSVFVTLLFIASDVLYVASAGVRWFPVALLAAAYGVINSVGSEVAGMMTFVVTGQYTKLTNLLVDRLSRKRGRKKLTEADKLVMTQNLAVCVSFFWGAVLACWMNKRKVLFRTGVFSAVGILYGLLFYWLDMESFGGAWWLRKEKKMLDLNENGDPYVIKELEVVNAEEKLA